MARISLPTDDLSIETLESIRDDIKRYGHLAAYKTTFQLLTEAIISKKADKQIEADNPSWTRP